VGQNDFHSVFFSIEVALFLLPEEVIRNDIAQGEDVNRRRPNKRYDYRAIEVKSSEGKPLAHNDAHHPHKS
jgi:hypothetical protein